MSDKINPPHYAGLSPQPIEVIEAWGLDEDFYLATALKYLARAGKKEGESELDDLKKCLWYVQRKVHRLERQRALAEAGKSEPKKGR